MASSNIKLFDENKGNMLTDTEFNISTQRLNGLQTGVASSQLQNKAMYQASLIAYAIAQIMMQNGLNANDTDAVSAFVANLSGTMLQKVYDIATTAEAQAGVATGKWMSPALVKAAINYMLANPVQFDAAATFKSTVTLAQDPTSDLQAVTKRYVDSHFPKKKYLSEITFQGTTRIPTLSVSNEILSYNNIEKVSGILIVADVYFNSIPSAVAGLSIRATNDNGPYLILLSKQYGSSFKDPTDTYHSEILFSIDSMVYNDVSASADTVRKNTYFVYERKANSMTGTIDVTSRVNSNVGTFSLGFTGTSNTYSNGTIKAYALVNEQ